MKNTTAVTCDILHGDCLDHLRDMPDSSVDAIVTDPPYGLSNTSPDKVADTIVRWASGDREHVPEGRGFMGRPWDAFVPPPAVWDECLRVLKPGGHLLVFAGSRTQDLMGLSIRLAGFELRDSLAWIYGSGFPKSMDVSKAIDKQREERHEEALKVTRRIAERAKELGVSRRDINLKINGADNSGGSAQSWTTITSAGAHKPRVPEWDQWVRLRELLNLSDPVLDAEVWRLNGRKGTPGEAWEKREVVGKHQSGLHTGPSGVGGHGEGGTITTSASDAAKRWSGWGTALKPAQEPIIMARKPMDGTVAANVLTHGVGGINVDGCRVHAEDAPEGRTRHGGGIPGNGSSYELPDVRPESPAGRFPPNVLLDPDAAAAMDEQSGNVKGAVSNGRTGKSNGYSGGYGEQCQAPGYGDSGGASRFFPVFKYQAKAPKRERPVIEREDGTRLQHPTVKPLALMEWLVTLITPPEGVVLDPFAGSGTTLQAARDKGFRSIGIEADADHVALIRERLEQSN